MMGGSQNQPTPSQADISDEQNMQDAGLKVWQNLKSGKITCEKLSNDDFEKLGEYFMGQAAGGTQNHVYWDQRIQQMMGDQGDTQMHVVWGERGSGCSANAALPSNTPSFLSGMMGGGGNSMMWGYGGANAAGWGAGFGVLGFLTWLVVLIDLILLGFWLFKKIKK